MIRTRVLQVQQPPAIDGALVIEAVFGTGQESHFLGDGADAVAIQILDLYVGVQALGQSVAIQNHVVSIELPAGFQPVIREYVGGFEYLHLTGEHFEFHGFVDQERRLHTV